LINPGWCVTNAPYGIIYC